MKLDNYGRTVALNLLFVILLPVLLSYFVNNSMIWFTVYLLLYSFIESSMDIFHYDNIDISLINYIKVYALTVIFNFILLFGISLILEYFLFNAGLIIVFILSLLWILILSKVELWLDKKLMKG